MQMESRAWLLGQTGASHLCFLQLLEAFYTHLPQPWWVWYKKGQPGGLYSWDSSSSFLAYLHSLKLYWVILEFHKSSTRGKRGLSLTQNPSQKRTGKASRYATSVRCTWRGIESTAKCAIAALIGLIITAFFTASVLGVAMSTISDYPWWCL